MVTRRPDGSSESIWWSGDRHVYNRPQQLQFGTLRGMGFNTAQCVLSRDIRRDWPDMNLLDEVFFVGDDGSIAYEGRLTGNPRTWDTAQGQSMQPSWVGWMAHAQDRPFSELYLDRTFARWADMSLAEKARLLVAAFDLGSFSWATDQLDGLICALPVQSLATNTFSEIWYTAPAGTVVAKAQYVGNDQSLPAGFNSAALLSADDDHATGEISTAMTLDGTLRTATPASAKRFQYLRFNNSGAAVTPAAGSSRRYSRMAMIGNHGLTTRANATAGEPDTIWLSDILTNIGQRFCPKLSMAGVQTNTYGLSQAVYEEVTPYAAWQDLNKYALWELDVFENKTLYYRPADLTDYDWEVRLSDPGVSTTLQGETSEDLWSGIRVQYTDSLTGRVEVLSPDQYPDLLDTSIGNPVNTAGYPRWLPYQLAYPASQADALQAGRMKLAEANSPKEAGTITATGHIRDRAGHWQQVWKVRDGDTIAITDFANPRARLIVETNYDCSSYTLQIGVDNTLQTVEGFSDRALTALQAAGLV